MPLEERKPYIAKCPRCSQCKWLPSPKSAEFAPICPSIQYGNFHSYSASGKGFTAYGLMDGRVDYTDEMLRSVYACTMCGACDTACKTNFGDNVEPLDTLYALRNHIVEAGHALPVHVEMMKAVREHGNPEGRPRSERDAYAKGLNLRTVADGPTEILLHVGTGPSYDQSEWHALHFGIGLLRRAGVDFSVAGAAEPNSGGLAYDLGFQQDALDCARETADLIARSGARTLVVYCAEAYAAFRNIYPRMGVSLGDVAIVHFTEYLDTLIADGRLKLAGSGNARVTYHDPCKLGRLSEPYQPWNGRWTMVLNVMHVAEPPRNVLFGVDGNYDAPRRLLAGLDGVTLVEMERSREVSYCCGAAGGGKEAFPEFAEKAARDRLREAEATGAEILVTACSGCADHLRDVARRAGSPLEVRGLLDLVAAGQRDTLANEETAS